MSFAEDDMGCIIKLKQANPKHRNEQHLNKLSKRQRRRNDKTREKETKHSLAPQQ